MANIGNRLENFERRLGVGVVGTFTAVGLGIALFRVMEVNKHLGNPDAGLVTLGAAVVVGCIILGAAVSGGIDSSQ